MSQLKVCWQWVWNTYLSRELTAFLFKVVFTKKEWVLNCTICTFTFFLGHHTDIFPKRNLVHGHYSFNILLNSICYFLKLIYFILFIYIFGCVGSSLLHVGFSLVVASGGYSSLQCAGFSLRWLLLLWSTGSRHAGSVVVAHGLSCSAPCGIFPGQGLNPCSLRWQADS